jgi:diaminopimelate dehydrogenase
MKQRTRVAIVGHGRLGRACVQAATNHAEVELAGVVLRPGAERPASFRVPVAGHVRDLERVDVVLMCVPPNDAHGVAGELLRQRFAVVECAAVDASRRADYHEALADLAARQRARIMLGAGWDPGMLGLIRGAFDLLIPSGRTLQARRPLASLHHTAAARGVEGVEDALAVEHPGADGSVQRYLYLQLGRGADSAKVEAAVAADPAFAGEVTQVFVVESIAALEEEAEGVLLERLGTAASGAHQSLLLEARGDAAVLAARVMLDAARRLPGLPVGGHRFNLA